MQVQRDESAAGADGQRRPVGAEANEPEVAGELGEAMRGAVRELGNAIEPVEIVTVLEAIPPLHEGEAPGANGISIRLRLGKGGLAGEPSGRGSPHGFEFPGRGEALLHAIEKPGVRIAHREQVRHRAEHQAVPRRSLAETAPRSPAPRSDAAPRPTLARSPSASPRGSGTPGHRRPVERKPLRDLGGQLKQPPDRFGGSPHRQPRIAKELLQSFHRAEPPHLKPPRLAGELRDEHGSEPQRRVG